MKILIGSVCFLFLVTVIYTDSKAMTQTYCSPSYNGSVACQNYNDDGTYAGQTNFNKSVDGNSWSSYNIPDDQGVE